MLGDRVMTHSGLSAPRDRFVTTRWSLVLAAGRSQDAASERALATLCELYWYPVYVFIRRHGHSADDAADLTQEFFTGMLEGSGLRQVTPEGGRFRSFVIACVRHFLSNEQDRARALKRGGGRPTLSLEVETAEGRYVLEPRDELTPDKIFDRRWALTLLDRALTRLRDEYAATGKRRVFGALKGFLTGDSAGVPYAAVAATLGTTEGAAKVAVHRFRRRFRDLLIEDVAATVEDPRDVDDEIRHLLEAVSSSAAGR